MGSAAIILQPPWLYFLRGALQGQEPVFVETFLPEQAVEGFDKDIARRFTKATEVRCCSIQIGSPVQRLADEFRGLFTLMVLRKVLSAPTRAGTSVFR